MNANINSVVVTLSDGNTKNIKVKDGMVLILMGNGPMDGAFYKKLEDCTEGELAAAEAFEETTENNLPTVAETPTPCGDSLDDEYHNTFDTAVDFLANCSGEDFIELVNYAKAHGNKFFHCVKEVADVINADDAYCSAIIKLARHLGKDVENKAFKLFAREDKEAFIDFWNALQTINNFS